MSSQLHIIPGKGKQANDDSGELLFEKSTSKGCWWGLSLGVVGTALWKGREGRAGRPKLRRGEEHKMQETEQGANCAWLQVTTGQMGLLLRRKTSDDQLLEVGWRTQFPLCFSLGK